MASNRLFVSLTFRPNLIFAWIFEGFMHHAARFRLTTCMNNEHTCAPGNNHRHLHLIQVILIRTLTRGSDAG